jgi:TrmH family RNA methyltransferase
MITSKDNEKLKLIRKLAERKHREREGLFLAEGEDLVAAAEAAGWEPELVLWSGEDVEPELLDAVSSLGSGTRVIAVYRTRDAAPTGSFQTYLHEIGDPGNVGAIVRSADAFVGGSIILGPGCADPYGPKAVRSSMGSIFRIRVVPRDITHVAAAIPLVGLVAHGGEPLDDDPVGTLLLGGERGGLPDDVTARCDRLWTIPVREGVESLNVAAAAAIALGRISSAA